MSWRGALLCLLGLVLRGAAPAWDLRATLAGDGRSLAVEGRFAPGDADTFLVEAEAAPFVSGVEVAREGRWEPVAGEDGQWRVPGAEARGARLRWRFDLAAASAVRGSGVRRFGDGYLARPRTFVLRPEAFVTGRPAELAVATPPGLAFVSGLGPDRAPVATTVDALDRGPEAAFGPFRILRFTAKGGTLAAVAPTGAFPLTEAQEVRWFQAAIRALEDAYGRLPLPWTAVYLLPTGRRDGILFGSTRGMGGASITVLLGARISEAQVDADWILTHELIHTALPDLDPSHHWLEEGLPTYLEPLLRLREGREPPEAFWAALRANLPQGEPAAGDRGLDRTPTWGRTYWGGALFCFAADLRIRELTGGRQTLLDAVRAILPAGGIATEAGLRDLLERADRALPKPVLEPLYEAWATAPEGLDLPAAWTRLGVAAAPFDPKAPLAALRRGWGLGSGRLEGTAP